MKSVDTARTNPDAQRISAQLLVEPSYSSPKVVQNRSSGRREFKRSRKPVKKVNIPDSPSLPDLTGLEKDLMDRLASEFTRLLRSKFAKPRQPSSAIKVRNNFEPLGVDTDADDFRMSLESVSSTQLDTPLSSTVKSASASSSSRREWSEVSRSEKKRKLPDSEKVSLQSVRKRITAPSYVKPKKDVRYKYIHFDKARPAVDKAKLAVEKTKPPSIEKVKPISSCKDTLS